MYEVFRISSGYYGLLNESFQLKAFQSTISRRPQSFWNNNTIIVTFHSETPFKTLLFLFLYHVLLIRDKMNGFYFVLFYLWADLEKFEIKLMYLIFFFLYRKSFQNVTMDPKSSPERSGFFFGLHPNEIRR